MGPAADLGIFVVIADARAMPSTLGLYRQLLRVTTIWPSKNRGKIMQEIREEFRQNRAETDATKLQKMFSDANTGLQTMRTQVGWKDSPEIGNTSGVLSGIKPAAGDLCCVCMRGSE